MRVKTFEAGTMQEALDTVKREMGEEAFILSTRTRKKPKPGGGEESFIEVTAAVDEAQQPPPKPESNPLIYGLRPPTDMLPQAPKPRDVQPAFKLPRPRSKGEALTPAPTPPPTPPPPPEVDLQPLRKELLEIKGAVEALKDQDARTQSILGELDQLKSLLSRIQRQGMPPAQLQLPPALLELYGDLVANDVEPLVALRLCEYAQRALQEHDERANVTSEKARLYLKRTIADFIPVAPPIQLELGQQKVAALVGPTGVGKTTTLAKLAAYAQLTLKLKVALVTLDTYRMGAVDQLQQFAQILGVPLHVALSVEDLRHALRFYQDRALVLIDTPGHSPKDTEVLAQLRKYLDELPGVEVHLVLAATTKAKDLAEIARRFEAVRPSRLVFTKLDETVTYGSLFSVLVRVKRPVSYLAMGQEVPQDLEPATSRRLSELILPAREVPE